ncbi:MAG: diguanylate cyclase (GGDEF)-like protein/PAS domain S-box-containing protein [Myxococcota bacterium]|jgi:diguanylate cyclase (GGDEF)-like protein/PAS domain S-box-containing protein
MGSAPMSTDDRHSMREHLGRALQGGGIGLWDWQLQTDVLTLSSHWRELLGASSEEATPDVWLARVHPLDQQRVYQLIAEAIDGTSDTLVAEHRLRSASGEHRWVLVQGRISRIEGEATHLSGSIQDLSIPRLHDSFTALPNRGMLILALERVLEQPGMSGAICLGINRFQRVNEIYGHAAGDELLRHVGDQLSACLQAASALHVPAAMEHVVACLGEGEFMILCKYIDRIEEIEQVAERLQEALPGVVSLKSWRIRTTTSAGLRVIFPGSATAGEVIRDARAAMHQARELDVERLIFSEGMHKAAFFRMDLEAEMLDAIRREEFVLEYQPVVSMCSGEMVGVEALVRWISPTRGRISPGDFISIAEETGLIVPLGEWILRTGCQSCARWRRELGHDLHIAINVSALQLQQAGFADLVERILQETGLPPTALHLELTESAFIADEAAVAPLLERFKALGVTLLLDDFGTGYSALSYLSRLPLDVLKIDRAFVSEVVTDPQAASLTRTIMALAQILGMGVIAEGIETIEQALFLQELGCDLVQGFYYSRPLSESELFTWNAEKYCAA